MTPEPAKISLPGYEFIQAALKEGYYQENQKQDFG